MGYPVRSSPGVQTLVLHKGVWFDAHPSGLCSLPGNSANHNSQGHHSVTLKAAALCTGQIMHNASLLLQGALYKVFFLTKTQLLFP